MALAFMAQLLQGAMTRAGRRHLGTQSITVTPARRRGWRRYGTVQVEANLTSEAIMVTTELARTLTRYKAWANQTIFAAVAALPEGEATKPRPTLFKTMVHTLNHSHVIDRIFQAHLEGTDHGFTARNTEVTPPLAELWSAVQALDRWYVARFDALSAVELAETVRFQFVGGGDGAMTRGQILLHADMMNQASVNPPPTDLPVFLRDVPQT
jgi:uncharacterized damage-inducible protein DinB